MAQIFPINGDAGRSSVASGTLMEALGTLPERWTLLRDRRIGASGVSVPLVLVHSEVGVALIDDASSDAAAGAEALRDMLGRERFGEFFAGELPIVALRIALREVADLERRVIAAFDGAPALSIRDRDWADALIELLLQPGDLAMVPIGPAARPPPIDSDIEDEAPRFSTTTVRQTEPSDPAEPTGGLEEHLFAFVLRKRWRAGTARRGQTMQLMLTALAASAFIVAIGSFAPGPRTQAPATIAPTAEIEPPAVASLAAAAPLLPAPVLGASRRTRPAAHHHVAALPRCADWLHQNRPGGSDYRGPPVARCPGVSRPLLGLRAF